MHHLDLTQTSIEHFDQQPEECKFFSRAGTFCGRDHMLDHKTNLNKLERIEITDSMLSDNNIVKLEITNRKMFLEIHKYVKITHF